MPSQIVLSWEVDVTNTPYGPAQAASALAAVPLYLNTVSDPVLGGLFGLTVAGDTTTTPSGNTAMRTLTLNMAGAIGSVFPCQPVTSTPDVPPYPLFSTKPLAGSFYVTTSSSVVATTVSQKPSLSPGDQIQFLSQNGAIYTVQGVSTTAITLTAPYSGVTGNTGAYIEVSAPAKIAAVYSTSDRDSDGVATTPAIAAGDGARTVIVSYKDSTGAGSFQVTVNLTGRRPAALTLHSGSIDIAEIESISIDTSGAFGNSVGQITLCELSSALPDIPGWATPDDFPALTDQAQMLIERGLAFIPPSYFAIAQQNTDIPNNEQLSGPLAQFVNPAVAAPPLNPPLDPSRVPLPTFLSGLFTQTLQLALTVPVSAQQITFV